ncbi:MAG: hypothetical protein KF832_07630 [Caldilineaceae bacterium]|nr:hypothetical protein [Caldilineaceae bacterium]
MNRGPVGAQAASSSRNVNGIMRDLQRIWQVLRDPAVPSWKWFLPIGALVYWVMPIDLIPFLPFDDIAVVILAVSILSQMAARTAATNPNPANEQPNTPADQTTIDTTWRVVDK